jgi:hypothetical protein
MKCLEKNKFEKGSILLILRRITKKMIAEEKTIKDSLIRGSKT